jgi:hypothetical protein
MKKLLTLFLTLFTLVSFGQSYLDFSQVNSVTQVGDQLVVKFQYFKNPQLGEATLTQFDFQYNNKLLSYVSHEWQVVSTSAQKARNSWNGYKYTTDAGKDVTDYDGQYQSFSAGTATYATNADWTVERITVQDVTGYPTEAEFVKYTFTIKDKGVTNYTDYTNLIQANWANFKESDGTLIDVTAGGAGQTLSLTDIKGGDAGNVTLNVFSNVITDNIGDGSHFGYTIYLKSDFDAGVTQNTPVVSSGNFDASGQATVSGLVNDTEYFVSVYIDSQQAYLDQVVTISDLVILFQEAIGAGNTPNGQVTTLDYAIQKLLGNVVGEMGVNAKVDFQDSYEVLAHLQGVTSTNNPRISKVGMGMNVSGIKSTFGDKNANGNPTFTGAITPTDSNKVFDFAHALFGDVNFSHSFQPTSQNATIATVAMTKSFSINQGRYVAENRDIDLSSQIVDGDVVFTINSQVEGMVGSQFNIEYDRTKLVLSNVIFDTGNEMTNFSNHLEAEGKINIGSFDQNFTSTVKVGTPYKLVFTPIVQLQNTVGLITFKVKEGVKTDGTQITFNIQ